MFKRITEFLNEYLRINAVRRMRDVVDVRTSEVVGLVGFAVLFALFEGVGLALLLPVLQYAESGTTAITESTGVFWTTAGRFMTALNLPITLPVLLAMAFIPILLRQVVFYFNTWYSAVVSSRIGIRLRMRVLRIVMAADPEFFTRNSVGHIVGVIVGQTGTAGVAILVVLRQLSTALLMLLYLALLMIISVPLTMIALVSALLVSASVRTNFVRIRNYGVEAARISQELMGKIVERLSLMRLIKLRNQEGPEAGRIEEYSETMRVLGIKQARVGAMVEVTSDPLLMLSVFVTLYIGISALGMSLAELGLLLFLINRLNAKVKEFNAGRQMISSNISGLMIVREMIADAVDSNRIQGGTTPFTGLTSAIELQRVWFTYPETRSVDGLSVEPGKPVLKDVSVTIPAGSFTALVGRSGAGKSTLVELLPRLRDVTDGSITLDGVDITKYEIGSLRKGIGYLTQSAMLFSDTVRENLVYGLDYTPSDEDIRHALEDAFATFVYDLPNGLETRLGDQGVRFSGGERQRIGLARVLLEDNSIIVLDEPTSALDSESESFIQEALHRLHGKKTVIVIAHRLATVIRADQLLVIEHGRIAEQGTHAELIAHEGAYHKLFESQLIR